MADADDHATGNDRPNPESAYEGRTAPEAASGGTERSSVANGPSHANSGGNASQQIKREQEREGGGAASERE
jgi:hypothetical protein